MPYDDDSELPISDVYYGNNMMTDGWGFPVYEGEKLYLDNSSVIGYELDHTRRLAVDVDNQGSAVVTYQARRENQYNDAVWTAFINVSDNTFVHHETSELDSNRYAGPGSNAVSHKNNIVYSADKKGTIWMYNVAPPDQLFPSEINSFNISSDGLRDGFYFAARNKAYFAAGTGGIMITSTAGSDTYNQRWIYSVKSEVLSIALVGNYIYAGLANGSYCTVQLDTTTGLPTGAPVYKNLNGTAKPITKIFYDHYNSKSRIWFIKTNDFEIWNVTVNNPSQDTFGISKSQGCPISFSNITSIIFLGNDAAFNKYLIADGNTLKVLKIYNGFEAGNIYTMPGRGHTLGLCPGVLDTSDPDCPENPSIVYSVYRDRINGSNDRVFVWNTTGGMGVTHIRNYTLSKGSSVSYDSTNDVVVVLADNRVYVTNDSFYNTSNIVSYSFSDTYGGANYGFITSSNRYVGLFGRYFVSFTYSKTPSISRNSEEIVLTEVLGIATPINSNYLYFTAGSAVGTIDISGNPFGATLAYFKRITEINHKQRTIKQRPGSTTLFYIACDYYTVKAVNFVTPSNPSTWAVDNGPSSGVSGKDLAFTQGNNHVIVTTTDQYRVFEIGSTTPTNPTSFALNGVQGVFINDNRGYFTTSTGLQIRDLTNPTSPSELGNKEILGTQQKLQVIGSYAYVTSKNFGLAILNVQNPAAIGNPIYKISSNAVDVIIVNGHAYISDASEGLIIVDVSDPTSITGLINSDPDVKFYQNSTAYAVWASDNAVLGRPHYPNGSIGEIETILRGMFSREVGIGIGYDGTDVYTHVVFVNNTEARDRIYYVRKVNNNAWSSATVVDGSVGGDSNEVKIDVKGKYVSIAFTNNDNIVALLSSNNGGTFERVQVTDTSTIKEFQPDIYVTKDGYNEVVYSKSRSDTAPFYTIVSKHNFYEPLNTATENYFIDDRNPNWCYNQSNAAICENNGMVSVIYEDKEIESSNPYDTFWKKSEVFVMSWINLFNKNNDTYRWVSQADDPGGKFLVEGLKVSANCSGVEWPLSIEFTDTNSNISWDGMITIPASGCYNQEFKWYSDMYFVTNGNYTITIRNGSITGDRLLRVAINNYLYGETPLNISYSGVGENGSYLSPYMIDFEILFEYGNQLVMDKNKEENEKTPFHSSISSNNYADLKFFELERGRMYNFSLIKTSENPGFIELLMFKEDVQLTNASEALFSINNTVRDHETYLFTPEDNGKYFVIIKHCSGSESTNVSYTFYFGVCPGRIQLDWPKNLQFVNLNNESRNYEPVTLKWYKLTRDFDIQKYEYQVASNQSMDAANITHSGFVDDMDILNATINLTVEQIYYWRVRAIDQTGNIGNWSLINAICFDKTNPKAPVIFPLESSYLNESFVMFWNASDDGIYDVAYYNVYYSRDPNFVPSEDNFYTKIPAPITAAQIKGLKNYRYFFKVQAVDNVGRKSPVSNTVDTTFMRGGYIDPAGQYFGVSVGDIIEYEVTFVESPTKNSFNEPMMEFYYRYYSQGSRLHFWIKTVNTEDIMPVRGDLFINGYNRSTSGWVYVDYDVPLTFFTLSTNETYQELVLNLTTRNMVGNATFDSFYFTRYFTNWRDGTDARDVVCYIYYTEPGTKADAEQTTVNYIIDKSTGILLEMVYYNKELKYGYNLKIVTTSVQMNQSDWVYMPWLWPLFIFATVGIVQFIISKREFA